MKKKLDLFRFRWQMRHGFSEEGWTFWLGSWDDQDLVQFGLSPWRWFREAWVFRHPSSNLDQTRKETP